MVKKLALAVVALAAVALVVALATPGTTPTPVVESPPTGETTTIFSPPGQPVPPKLAIVRIAHSSVLVDFDGEIVLTDPWFSDSSQYHHGEPLGVALADVAMARASQTAFAARLSRAGYARSAMARTAREHGFRRHLLLG